MHSYHQIEIGQALLIACCAFYLIWWSLCYRPGQIVNRSAGGRGVLLASAAVCGIAGMVLSVAGANGLTRYVSGQAAAAPSGGQSFPGARVSGAAVLIGWAAAYLVLFLITYVGMKRPVTTELMLITGWAALEVFVIGKVNGAGQMADAVFWALLAFIAACFAVSIVFYVLYYKIDKWRAFYMAMIPLITEAGGMAAVLIALAAGRR